MTGHLNYNKILVLIMNTIIHNTSNAISTVNILYNFYNSIAFI